MPTLPRAQVYAAVTLVCILLALAGASLRRRLPPVPPLPSVTSTLPAGKDTPALPANVPSGALPLTPVPPRLPVVVHVVGCVRQPGVYAFQEGARVYDALKRAGGAKSGADLESINLAARLQDGVQVYVPRQRSAGDRVAAAGPPRRRPLGSAWLPPEGLALDPLPPAPPGRVPLEQHAPEKPAQESARPPAGAPGGTEPGAKIHSPSEGRVNINTAGAQELQRLPHIGPAMAQRILDYRKENGAFRSIDQLAEVKGIGEKRLAELRDLVEL